jgi:ferritin
MITKPMQDAINVQVQAEIHSSMLYLAMSASCASQGFNGFASWLRVQRQEEMEHALKLLDYLLERGGTFQPRALEAAPASFGTPLQVFEKVLEHERHVTSLVHGLYEKAVAEKDIATQVFLQWYVAEQVEEEAHAQEVVDKLKYVGDRGGGVLYLDKELGKRGKA